MGNIKGKVIIQTYEPDNYSIEAACSHDYESFFSREIAMRELMKYPPFSDLIMVNFTAEDDETADAGGISKMPTKTTGRKFSRRSFLPASKARTPSGTTY